MLLPKAENDCIFLSGDPAEKLSGGFYDHGFIPESAGGYHRHGYFATTYVLQGYGVFKDHLGNCYDYEPGDLMIRHSNTRFFTSKHYSDESWMEFSLALPGSFAQALYAGGVIRTDLTFLSPGISDKLLGLAAVFVKSINGGVGKAYAAFLDYFNLALEASQGLIGQSQEERIMEQARAMLGRFDSDINAPWVAAQLNMSYESFRHRFRQSVGISPNSYRIKRRLEQADALLLHTSLSIKEIADRLGYSEQSCFTRQYKKYFGRSPLSSRQ
ncbi:MAG: AraC family transcriptional regulator [Victivallales bacterium]|jgi:AraC-like DNA-binding protein|nr:AraC family transcriptional regulator [Victivallales bacterium]